MLPSLRLASAELRNLFKSSMARVSSQAMVLTAGFEDASKPLHGMTLSSVCSLSVFPTPMLQFNLHLPSYTSSALHANDGLCLHIMPPTQRSVFLGRTFASGVKKDPEHFDVKPDDGDVFHEMTTPFSCIDANDYTFHEISPSVLVPVLSELEVAFVCQKSRVFTVDSHEIWVVKVVEVLFPNGRPDRTGGLLYFDRGFHKVGGAIRE